MSVRNLIPGALFAFASWPAQALCSTTDVTTAYREADVVARVTVVAHQFTADDEPSSAWIRYWGDYSPVALYRFRVTTIFKGKPGSTIKFFEPTDSGRLDPSLGKEYLLFLHYYPRAAGLGEVTRGATYVKHVCGPSGLWTKVSNGDMTELTKLAQQSRISRR